MNLKYKNIKEYLVWMLFFFLPSWMLLQNILAILLFIFSLIFERKYNYKILKNSLLLFVMYLIVNITINDFFITEKNNIIRLLPLVLIPFGLKGLEEKSLIKGLLFLLIGTLLIQIKSIYSLIEYLNFFNGKKYNLTNYSKLNDILGYERPYLGFFSAINILLSYIFYKRRKSLFFLFSGALSIFLILYLGARLAFIISSIFLIYIIYKETGKVKYKMLYVKLGILSIVLFLSLSNSSLIKRFSLLKKDSRNVIWQGVFNEINTSRSYVFGISSLEKFNYHLKEFYKNYIGYENEAVRKRFISKNYNAHNQFLTEFVRGGIVGVFLFCFPFFRNFALNLERKNIINILFLIAIILFLLVENLLDRQIGVYIVSIFLFISSYLKMKYEKI
ncbi:O-antigen ligase family protein [Tenacibaculum sp. 190524A02b]|uniref:O-antigen ligase family protein n=1 Tax=Tenacibaculum vairaonense TaxID=3137860 RepID=UPI0031FB364C